MEAPKEVFSSDAYSSIEDPLHTHYSRQAHSMPDEALSEKVQSQF